jgi:hypothetical protein
MTYIHLQMTNVAGIRLAMLKVSVALQVVNSVTRGLLDDGELSSQPAPILRPRGARLVGPLWRCHHYHIDTTQMGMRSWFLVSRR